MNLDIMLDGVTINDRSSSSAETGKYRCKHTRFAISHLTWMPSPWSVTPRAHSRGGKTSLSTSRGSGATLLQHKL